MGKSNKKPSKAYMVKLQKQIAKDLAEKSFSSVEEISKYIQENYAGANVKSGETKPALKNKAQDLIYDALELGDPEEMILLAEKALKLDQNCTDAYNILAQFKAKTSKESLELYSRAIEAGKKSLGKDFEEYKGHFWGFYETRPFMRAMSGYSFVLWDSGENNKSIEIMKEMLQLNPNDNQGVRHVLISKLLIMNRLLEAEKLYKDYEDDYTAAWHYSKAYLYFVKRSKQLYADKAIKDAMIFNPYVPLYLFGLRDMPDNMPEYVGFGDENEAVSYVEDAMELWGENKKAAKWFADIYSKMKYELDKLIDEREKENRKRRNL